MSLNLNASLHIGVSLIAILLAQGAMAQSAPPVSTSQPTTASDTGGLEEIVVTAEKREEKIQNVPVSITAIKGDSLKKYSLFNFQDFASLTAGLDLSQVNGNNQTETIRGISYNFFSGSLPTTDVYVNEVVANSPTDVFRVLFDISQLEVLRGPTGTLFGRTSPAGAITETTHRPEMNNFGGYISQSYSDRDFENTEAAVNVPLIDDILALRIAGVNEDDHGFLTKDLLSGKEEINHTRALRESILFRPTDDLEFTLIHLDQTSRSNNYQEIDGPGNGVNGPSIAAGERASLSTLPVDYMNRQDDTTLLATYNLTDNLTINYVGGAQLESEPYYVYGDPTNTIPAYKDNYSTLTSNLRIYTQEARLQSQGNDFWNYIFGVYFSRGGTGTVDLAQLAAGPFLRGPPRPPTIAGFTNIYIPETKQNFAFFTNQRVQITDDDEIQVSGRWSQENDFAQARLNVLIPKFHLDLAEPPLISPQDQRTGYHYPTGGASFTHHFDEDLMVYATWSHGFRPGGVNVGVTNAGADSEYVVFGPEFSDEFEIGSKASFFEHRLTVSGDIYYQKFHGYQGQRPTVYWRLGDTGPSTANITMGTYNGDASSQGIEVQAEALITPDWHMGFSGAYADAHYNQAAFPCNDYLGLGIPNNAPPGVTPRIQGTGQTSFCVENSSISTAAPWSLSLNTEYDYPDSVFGAKPFVRVLSTFHPAYRLVGTPTIGFDPLFLTNLYLGVRDPDGGWEVQLFVKNLFDTVITDYSAPNDITAGNNLYDTGYKAITQNPPREIGFTARYNF